MKKNITILIFLLIVFSISLGSFKITWGKSCEDYGEGYACRNYQACDPNYTLPDYTICGSSGYLYCCKANQTQPPPSGQSCEDYGEGYACRNYQACDPNYTLPDYTICGSSGYLYCCKANQTQPPGGDNTNPPSQNTSLIIENPLSPISDIWQLIMRLINIAQNIGVFVCVILIVWAGYLYITSVGNEEKIKQAQKTLIWALVGFGIIVIAGAVPRLIYEFITGKSWESLYNQKGTKIEHYYSYFGKNERCLLSKEKYSWYNYV